MAKQQLNVRIPTLTRWELDWLTARYGMNEAQVVILAIDALYHRNEQVSEISKQLGKEIVGAIVSEQAPLDHPDE